MSLTLDEKHDLILNQEKIFAYSLAKEMINKPAASVWMILLPILFVYHMFNIQKYKNSIHDFANNYLNTKTRALALALEQQKTGEKKELSLEVCFPQVDSANDKEVRVCQKQLKEIEVLFEHYAKLLGGRGKTYESLLKSGYSRGGDYRLFLNRLAEAENEVNRYVLKHFQTTDRAKEITRKMEGIVDRFREQDFRKYF
ncbi:NF038143 family protein [Desulfonatronovibrio hydrogenovorans]|uniref:NF038143 family protein n=1 Tax=Desulfonatronovibrio hydrogenovorans TaxID=53245 RepID=UPI00048B1AF5|nr:NF038143 family protein [Desulfonatronovibrio hydrogenovorans]